MNENQVLISIIIPVFNTENYLKECLDSVINQTLKEIEIICINDGSTDNSLKIIESYAKKDDRIKIIDKTNEGQSVARNTGIQEAIGEYIAFVDSDDYIDQDAYEKLYSFAKKYDQDMILCDVVRFNSIKKWRAKLHRISIPKNKCIVSTNILKMPNLIYDTGPWNKLIKKSFWDENGFSFLPGCLYEDLLISAELHCAAASVGICPDTRYYWRSREGENKSTTQNTTNVKNLQDRVFIANKLTELYSSNPKYKSLLPFHYKKCIEHDFLLFINKTCIASEEFKKKLIVLICPFLKKIPKETDIKLGTLDKFKYQLLKEKDIETLEKITCYSLKCSKKTKMMKNICILINALKDNILIKLLKFYMSNKFIN
ncbi:MAG: glycosyltransferase [Methanobacteriaceae archaeon]